MNEDDIYERFFENEESEEQTEPEVKVDNLEATKDEPEQASEQTEESNEEKYVCPYCNKIFNSEHALKVHIGMVHKEEIEGKTGEGGGVGGTSLPEEPVIKSPKEELEEWFIKELEKRLPQAVGKQKAEIIVETIKDDPEIIWDPQRLRYHIIQLASRNINKYLLDWILNSLYRNLEEYKRSMEEMFGYMYPTITPPNPSINAPYPKVLPPRDVPLTQPNFQKPMPAMDYRFRPFEPVEFHSHQHYAPQPRVAEQRYPTQDAMLVKLLDKLLDKLDREKEEQKEPLVEVPNPYGSGTIKVPASQVPTYLMIKSVQDQVNALREAILKGQEKPKEEPKEQTVKIPTEDGVVELPASQAIYYIQMLHEKEKRREAEERLKRLEQQMVEMSKSFSPENLLKTIDQLGFRRYPSPTYELINKTRQDLNNMLDRILGMMELQMRRQMPPNLPQLQTQYGPKYTPEERQKKIQTIKENLKKAENLAKLEKEIAETVEAKK